MDEVRSGAGTEISGVVRLAAVARVYREPTSKPEPRVKLAVVGLAPPPSPPAELALDPVEAAFFADGEALEAEHAAQAAALPVEELDEPRGLWQQLRSRFAR